MKYPLICPVLLLAVAPALAADAPPASPPVAPQRPVQDTYFGTTITDPYRYFENVKNDPAVQAWFKGQADYARGVLDKIPGRDALFNRMRELSNSTSTRVAGVNQVPGRIFYEQRKAGENQYKLYTRVGWDAPEQLLFDPDVTKGPDGAPTAINFYSPSPNGRYLAVGVSPGGSEDASIRVLEVATGKDTGLSIPRARFGGVAWLDDESGFFYNQLKARPADAAPTLLYQDSQIRFHRLGTDAANDPLIFGTDKSGGADLKPAQIPFLVTIEGNPNAFALIEDGVRNELELYAAPLADAVAGKAQWRKLISFDDDVVDFTVHGDDMFVITHKDAPRFKMLRLNISAPDFARAEVVIPPGGPVLKTSYAARDALYVQLLDGGIDRLQRLDYALGAKPQDVVLPVVGSIGDVASNPRLDGLAMHLASWTDTGGYYVYNSTTGKVADTNLQPRGPFDQPQDLVAEEVRVPSHDGTMIPLSIVHKKDMKLDGSNPCWLNAYGAYGMVDTPHYGPVLMAWYELGGIYAIAHVRGGGAFGEEWHLAGQKQTKPNTWKDLIACAQWLEDHKYTSPARMAIDGGSAGGITVGRAMTDRPDLFRVVIGQVGVFNPLRAEQDPNGVPNIPEYGTATKAEEFPGLLEMDSYHHVKDGVKYPATLLTTGMNDPRVPPWEPGKFAARLQQAGAPLVLLRIDYDAGHGIGSTRNQVLAEMADEMAFALWQFGVPAFQPK